MNEYVILYSVKRWGVTWERNCSHVSIKANTRPSERQAYAAVTQVREVQRETMQGVIITDIIELRPGQHYKIPLLRSWPLTLRCFDRSYAKEYEQQESWIYKEGDIVGGITLPEL